MPIPDFQSILLPLLKLASDGKTYYIHEAVDQLADDFGLTEDEKTRLIPSGQQPVFYNRVTWARTYLKKAGLLENPQRGYFRITDAGRRVLIEGISKIDMRYLKKFPEFVQFREAARDVEEVVVIDEHLDKLTPEEALEEAYQSIRRDLASELLDQIHQSSPGFFEKLVIDLLVRMGYGGSHRDAARAVGQSGDEGIDGIIDEDRLGLDTIYIQAKKWKAAIPVSRPEIQKFVGALQGKRAKKGIFLTTSRFTEDAREYARAIDTKVVLIDGKRLTELMIDFGVGVNSRTTYDIKGIDTDYFGESSIED